ncbi:MAG TPA: zinc-binding alcohol dehydrogenase family protein [Opitutaceae bacterium]|nr:zinc-binding alcohol dehydrogenase family protein [Opitutaceae bacterium]
MTTIRLEEPGRFASLECAPPAPPQPGEALVRVRRVGVCGTDLHAFAGNQPFFSYPRVLGHELGVEVVAVGPGVANVKPGDRCSVEPYFNCQRCVACRRGKANCCADLRVLGVHVDGGMREQLVVPARKLHPSASLSLDQLALVETLGIGCHAVERACLEPGEFALVIGAGPIGLAVMQFAAERGARVVALDVNAARLDFCRRHLGVPHAVNGADEAPLDALRRLTGGDLPTSVFDATGSPGSMMEAFNFPAPGGRLVLVGLFQGDVTFNDPSFHRRELTLLGSRNAQSADFERIIGLIEAGRIDTAPWITHRAPLAGVAGQFPAWVRPDTGVIKAIVEV